MKKATKPPRGVDQKAWAELSTFAQAVYRAICRIPRGQTRSYRWVASQIGRPKAARAVGNALNKNPFAPKVPCHRIIRTNGMIGGYAGGTEEKRSILIKEGAKIS